METAWMCNTRLGSAVLLLAAGCWLLPTARADTPKKAETLFQVEVVSDIAYYQGRDADRAKHSLDLYFPRGKKGFPVLFFVHGGAWTIGDKKGDLGIYRVLGRSFARQGFGVVVPNYRLSPRVKHPEHVRDVARAFAWTFRNINRYGGRADALFLCGHSAGGHLVALLATDDTFLRAEGLNRKAIRGVITISGLFRIPRQALFDSVFGTDPALRGQASPLSHVRRGLPPFLIVCADKDLPSCGKSEALSFCAALKASKCRAEVLEVKERNHLTILVNVISDRDPVTRAMLGFVRKYTPTKQSVVSRQ